MPEKDEFPEETLEKLCSDLDEVLDDTSYSVEASIDGWETIITHANSRVAGLKDDLKANGG